MNKPCGQPLMHEIGCAWQRTEGEDDAMAGDEVDMRSDGRVPVPVAAMMEGSALRRSHSMVSPSDRWPNSRVSWNMRAAHMAGMRIRRPLPFTFVWRSLEEEGVFWRAFVGGWTIDVVVFVVEMGSSSLEFWSEVERFWRVISEAMAVVTRVLDGGGSVFVRKSELGFGLEYRERA